MDKIILSHLTLKGNSLGGGIATLVAQHFHQLSQSINVFSSRSFSSITDFSIGRIRLKRDDLDQAIGHKNSVKGIIAGWLVRLFIKFGISLVRWKINAGRTFRNILEKYRDYIAVRSQKNIRDGRIDDAITLYYASKQCLKSRKWFDSINAYG